MSTVVSTESIAEDDELSVRTDVITEATRRVYSRKNTELKRYDFTAGCPDDELEQSLQTAYDDMHDPYRRVNV